MLILIWLALIFTILTWCSLYAFISYRLKTTDRKNRTKTLIVLGSGGHTTEMLLMWMHLLELEPRRYSPRIYVYAKTDKFSGSKAQLMEQSLSSPSTDVPTFVPV